MKSKKDKPKTVVPDASKLCANCNTERFDIYCRGYCQRCYRLIVEREQVERWDLKNPSTLKGFPRSFRYHHQRGLEEAFPRIKAARLKELNFRSRLLKMRESQRTGKVQAIDIEHAFRRLTKWSGGKESAVRGIASLVNYHLDQEAQRALLGWLFDIEESMRWDPRRYWPALHPEEVERIVAENRARLESESPRPTRTRARARGLERAGRRE